MTSLEKAKALEFLIKSVDQTKYKTIATVIVRTVEELQQKLSESTVEIEDLKRKLSIAEGEATSVRADKKFTKPYHN